jgi:predicted phage terminase large subunit-like protein
MINSKEIKAEFCRRYFWKFEQGFFPDVFKEDRWHAKKIAEAFQALIEGRLLKADGTPYKKLMLNAPPRHLKSFSLINFCEWALGKNPHWGIMTASYNEKLSGRFSKSVRNAIDQDNIDPEKLTYHDVFPERIKKGDAAAGLWALEGSHFSYLGTSPKGTATGVGCQLAIIDDLIRDSKEAYNERVLEEHWSWYTDTFLSRIEEGGYQIVNFTRWNENDLCGMLLQEDPDNWYQLKFEVYDKETDTMLCDELMSKETYEDKKRLSKTPAIFMANYHQETVNEEGALYQNLKTYKPEDLPEEAVRFNYTDTADTGDDFLCSICYDEYDGMVFITDVYYTDEPMEVTEPAVAEMLIKNNTSNALIESNNGGRGFARAVQKAIDELGGSTVIDWFSQTQNKVSRILNESFWIQKNVYFPEKWHLRFPEFYKAITKYQRKGKNAHDDAPDCLTGCAERTQLRFNIDDLMMV